MVPQGGHAHRVEDTLSTRLRRPLEPPPAARPSVADTVGGGAGERRSGDGCSREAEGSTQLPESSQADVFLVALLEPFAHDAEKVTTQ